MYRKIVRQTHTRPAGAGKRGRWFIPALILALALLAFGATTALAVNPPPQQLYFVSLPEDDLLQLFDDNQVTLGSWPQVVSPIRSITSIAIGSSGTLVYWDQWEDGGYDADIANPGANAYANPGNLDGTQIWGDGVLANGCPPSIANVPNPCTLASDDLLQAGDVITLDNNVIVSGTTPGPYSRNAALVFFDGRDKFGTTFPVAVTRAAFPPTPGSVMAGANEVLDTGRWGTSYEAPLGEDTLDSNTNAFEDVRWFIMAGVGGATINVDANGDGDLLDANDLNGFVMAQGAKRQVNGILMGGTLTVVSGNAVQVNSLTADVDDTFEFRWNALIPRPVWTNNYYTPVGTAPKALNSGCTEVEVYNPNASTITINYDFPGGASPDGSFTVAAGNTATGQTTPATPLVLYNNGGRYWSAGGQVFLPISVTDCTRDTSTTDGRLYDWGNPLFPADQLTTQVLVPFAAGCSGESFLGVCRDADSQPPYNTRDVTTDGSRSPVWVTPLANTTIYVDYDGSGISCPTGAGSETSIAASALVSYRILNDPTSRAYVRHGFTSGNYTGSDNISQGWPQNSSAWANDWAETGDLATTPIYSTGAIQVVGGELRFGNTGTANETGWTVRRGVNLTGQNYANLRFQLRDNGLAATDKLAVEVTQNGTNWTRLATFQGDQVAAAYDPIAATYAVNISPYISANTAMRFVILNNMTGTNYWFVDNVHIDYAQGGDWDMTGSRIGTCDGTKIAAAWGQDPALSGSNDEEALDMGTGIAPFGADIAIEKSADKTVVAQGGLVNYSFAVTNLGTTNLFNVSVTDNKCSPAVYVSGDNNPADGFLNPFPAETWIYTCSSNIYFDTTNVAYSTGTPESETTPIDSAPDEWTVTVIPPAVIGNYVWLDEDGDGDQDAGEAGIPNVLVTLTGTDTFGNPVSLTTYTDANGGYLFDGLPPSNGAGYTVTVTPPAGLNQTYDENGVATPNATTVMLAAGDEHLSADFGYNWVPPVDTNNPGPGVTGAIGDHVWIDANGDGVQDPGEAGIPNVTVMLYTDPDGNGVYDTVAGTTTTDAAGNYIFDNLPAGSYVVSVTPPAGYNQTGDPDDTLDNRTTSPVVLGPGDVYVNADFGYQPAGTSSDIGDTVWFDANANGVQNTGEKGIPGVTVALVRDNGNGIYEPGIDQIIATDITDENGLYLFPGLPAGTYFVLVTDTENVLGELAPTYDADGGRDEISKVTINGIADNLLQDFGYAPPGQQPGEGVIGDTVWLDRDGDGLYDPGEGLEGVRVTLTDPGPDGILGTDDDTTRDTFTDENGNYSFGKLQPDGSYRVTVDTTTLPPGVTNTVDPDGGANSTSVVTLTPAAPINLNQDFAYRDLSNPNTVGGTLWEDRNADGTLDGTEPTRFAGVTVVLRNANGDIIATTTTDSNGDYLFSGLPDGTYTIDVTDDGNTLNGYWKSDGSNAGANNNSQVDPYTVTVSGGQTNLTGDFGYYIKPGSTGNWIWLDNADPDPNNCGPNDCNQMGVQDPDEVGIPNVKVTMTIAWPNGDTTVLTTLTDANGFYSFDNLLLDEDYNGIGSGEPTYTISVDTNQPALAALISSPIEGAGLESPIPPDLDSNNPAGTLATAIQGQTDTSAANNASVINWTDFGFYIDGTTPVSLAFFSATRDGDQVNFTWTTATEAGNAGFNLYVQTATGREKVNSKLIRSRGVNSLQPQDYAYQGTVSAGDVFFIEEVSVLQEKQAYGPFETGQPAGERLTVDKIDWAAVNAEHEMKQVERAAQDAAKVNQTLQTNQSQSRLDSSSTGYVKRASGLASMGLAKKPTPIALPTSLFRPTPRPTPAPVATATPAPLPTAVPTSAPTAMPTPAPTATPEPAPTAALRVAELKVNRTGIYRVTYEALLAAGLDLTGQPASDLALTLRNTPVPIRVSSPAAFGPGAYIEFYGEALDTLYTDTNVYVLWVDRSLAQRIGEGATAPAGAPLPTYYMETLKVNKQRTYDISAPTSDDPWYFLDMWSAQGSTSNYDLVVNLDGYVAGAAPAALTADLWGVVDYSAKPDQHLAIEFNGQRVADQWFDGLAAQKVVAQLPLDLAHGNANSLKFILPGDVPATVDYNWMYLDQYSITYPHNFAATNGRLTFTAVGPAFKVTNLGSSGVVAYRITGGVPTYLSGLQVNGGEATLAGGAGEATYLVSTVESLLRPVIAPATAQPDILNGAAQYLVISHPDFIGGLGPLVQARQAQGFTVKVVNVEDIYRQYSGGVMDPTAIREYIRHAATGMGTQYVLLVGGDNYDYRNYLGLNSVSFVPTLYAQTDALVRFAPVDSLYADINGDNVPDLAIGRLPVRTSAELTAVINKTLAYGAKTYGQTALFASDTGFDADSQSFKGGLPAGWNATTSSLSADGLATARNKLITTINQGVALTSFVGHSSPTNWTYRGLFTAADAAALTNTGKPTVVTQWGCWNTYFVDPANNTLGHKLMLSGENGSAAVLGATSLTSASSERLLGQLLTPKMTTPSMTVGAAIQAAKAELAATQPNRKDVILGWSLLGDPALMIQP